MIARTYNPALFARRQSTDKQYLLNVIFLGLILRVALVLLIWASDALLTLNLSSDAVAYHRVGIRTMQEMQRGFFNWPFWIDNGWFQFTGFVYFLFGPHPGIMQGLNILFGCLTIVVVFHLALEVSRSSQVARISALLVAVFPSFVFWSCLSLKDPLAILMMSLLVLCTVRLRKQFRWRLSMAMVLALVIFLGIRDYMFFVGIGLISVSMLFFTPYRVPRAGSWIGLATLALVPLAMGFGVFGYDYFITSHYMDIDYINTVRVAMGDHGTGAIFAHEEVATWGSGQLVDDVLTFLKGLWFFFVTLDLTEINSVRQMMALPEVLISILLLPHLVRGFYWLWLDRKNSFPVLVFTFGVMIMLISATTNLGALFRWRMQVLPLFVIAMAIGVFYLRRGALYRIACRLTGSS